MIKYLNSCAVLLNEVRDHGIRTWVISSWEAEKRPNENALLDSSGSYFQGSKNQLIGTQFLKPCCLKQGQQLIKTSTI